MSRRLILWITALVLGVALVGTPALAASPRTGSAAAAPAPAVESEGAPRPRADTRQARYAARETAAPRAADFKGNGVGIYIGGSTLAVVLVVVLILVLL
jgi:hypothetical protein